jgi:predicted transcriptional regulator
MAVHLTNRELDVMAVLWKRGSATVAEVREHLGEELAYTSVLTVLRALEATGKVRHETEGRAYRYYPQVQPHEVVDRTLLRLLDRVFQGSRELLLTRLISDENVSDEELRRLRAILDQKLEVRER